ncbi:MAG: transcription termination/antitermination protein NusG [Candidatus Omnitrophica bacterium]|nr:transcription termination/antitermination protein NusG [Candidatus Omnitrophota bacterium]
MEKHWYVIHALTGQEEKVKANILNRLELSNLKDKISQVLIPTEVVSEVKSGKKKISERKFFPGYVLVEMELTDESWYLIKNTPGVTGFISSGDKPTPLLNEEVDNILKQSEEKKEKPMPKVTFNQGESVRIKEGPFTNFNGTIEELNPARGKLKVLVMIFGRSTPVELEYWQVERL